MKNIWKFLMIALAAMMLVACPPADTGNTTPTTTIPGGPVWIAEIEPGMINWDANYWGSAKDSRTIKFILAPKTVKVTGENVFADKNKIYVYSHNDIDNGHIFYDQIPNNGWLQVAARYDNTKYAGTAVKKVVDGENTKYVVMIDLTKIATSDLCSKGSANGKTGNKDGESAMGTDTWGNFSKIAKDYVPYIVGAVTGNVYDSVKNKDGYEFDVSFPNWNCGVLKMKKTDDAFPTTVTKAETGEAPEAREISWAHDYYVKGAMNGWGDADAHDEYKVVNGVGSFTWNSDTTADADVEFKISKKGDWAFGFANFEITKLDEFVTLDGLTQHRQNGEKDPPNAKIKGVLLENGQKYSFVFEKVGDNTTCKVKLVKGEGTSNTKWAATDWKEPEAPASSSEDEVTGSSSEDEGNNGSSSEDEGGNEGSSSEDEGGNEGSSSDDEGGNEGSSSEDEGGNEGSSSEDEGNEGSSSEA